MTAVLQEIEVQALTLPPEERAELIHRLIISLDGETEASPDEIAKAWDAEIARRVADIDAGRVELIPAEKVFADIEAIIAQHGK